MNQTSPCDELIWTEQRHSMLYLDDILEVSEIYKARSEGAVVDGCASSCSEQQVNR